MFLGLALVLFVASRGAGIVAFLHAVLIALLPRLYLGLHYPSDMLGGAALVLLLVLPCMRAAPRAAIAGPFLRFAGRSPATFAVLAFLVLFGISTLFDPAIRLLAGLRQALAG